eukprot:366190-Chlamydomonas_euryale.AAC.11
MVEGGVGQRTWRNMVHSCLLPGPVASISLCISLFMVWRLWVLDLEAGTERMLLQAAQQPSPRLGLWAKS